MVTTCATVITRSSGNCSGNSSGNCSGNSPGNSSGNSSIIVLVIVR